MCGNGGIERERESELADCRCVEKLDLYEAAGVLRVSCMARNSCCKRRFDNFHHCVHRRSGNSHRTPTIRDDKTGREEEKKTFSFDFFSLHRLFLRKIVNRLDTHFEAKILSLMIIIIIMYLFAFPSGHFSVYCIVKAQTTQQLLSYLLFPGMFQWRWAVLSPWMMCCRRQ